MAPAAGREQRRGGGECVSEGLRLWRIMIDGGRPTYADVRFASRRRAESSSPVCKPPAYSGAGECRVSFKRREEISAATFALYFCVRD